MATVTLNRASIYPFLGLTFLPGDNDVTAEQLKDLKAQKGFMRDVQRGILTLNEAAESRKRKTKAEPELALEQPKAEEK